MKKVFFCETPFQIIVSLYIKEQFSNLNDQVDIIIADTFNGYQDVANRLKEKKIFRKVFTCNMNDILRSKNICQYILKLFYILFPKKMIQKRWNKNIDDYDEMYCGNYDLFTASVRSYFAFKRCNTKIFLFDDGNLSYFPIDEIYPIHKFLKLLEIRNKLCGIPNIIRNNINGFILFEPENLLYKPTWPVFKINRNIENKKEFKSLINYIFKAEKAAKKYDKKYIIFEEAEIAGCKEIDDEKVFDEIIKIVGKDNVIVKLHPRTCEDRFTKKGIKTLGNDGVPWEAIACVGDFSDKILITISSSTITTYKMLFGNKMKAYMLFKFLKPNFIQFDSKYIKYWDKLGIINEKGGIYMPKSEKEFYNMLHKEI